jgi:polysaccharide pyruvyl transferase WcaK-like protein
VVNGEGTLHRSYRAPLNLLFLMHAARNIFGKPVYLINHSFFPSGGESIDPAADGLYGRVARTLTRVVPREPVSRGILARLGVDCAQGFDCLPRYIARHGFTGASRPEGPLLLSGGVNMNAETAARVAAAVRPHLSPGRRVCFLAGAKGYPAPEDAVIYEWMRTGLPELELLEARTMESWLTAIATASCLVSGRFHHTIAAATLGTPAVTFPSNTPKTSAMCGLFGLDAPIAYTDPEFVTKSTHAIDAALRGQAGLTSPETLAAVLGYAENNFNGL